MSFYIRIDNESAGGPSSPVGEGDKKVCLVSAFTAAVNDVPHPSGRGFRRENLGVAVTLAGGGTVTLPFMADEFEDLVLDAQRKGRIADFSSDNWLNLLDDLEAIRKGAPSVERSPLVPARVDFSSLFGPDILDHPRYDAIKRAGRHMQELQVQHGALPYYDPRFRRARDEMDDAIRGFKKSLRHDFRRAQLQSVGQTLSRVWQHLREPFTGAPPPPLAPRQN